MAPEVRARRRRPRHPVRLLRRFGLAPALHLPRRAPRGMPGRASRGPARRGRRGRSRSAAGRAGRAAADRPQDPGRGDSFSSSGSSSASWTPAYSARSASGRRDLGPGRGDEVPEHGRGDVLLVGATAVPSPRRGGVRTIVSAPAEARRERLRRSTREPVRLLLPSQMPASCTSWRYGVSIRRRPSAVASSRPRRPARADAARPSPGRGPPRRAPARARRVAAPAVERVVAARRGSSIARRAARPVEVLEPQVVVEEVRDPALEAVEPRERVLADRDEEVRRAAHGRSATRGNSSSKRAGSPSSRVVEEVLLELVEDHEQDRPPISSAQALERRRPEAVPRRVLRQRAEHAVGRLRRCAAASAASGSLAPRRRTRPATYPGGPRRLVAPRAPARAGRRRRRPAARSSCRRRSAP